MEQWYLEGHWKASADVPSEITKEWLDEWVVRRALAVARICRFMGAARWRMNVDWNSNAKLVRGYFEVLGYWRRFCEQHELDVDLPDWKLFTDLDPAGVKYYSSSQLVELLKPDLKVAIGQLVEAKVNRTHKKANKRYINQILLRGAHECGIAMQDPKRSEPLSL